jgi:hypothetical protein
MERGGFRQSAAIRPAALQRSFGADFEPCPIARPPPHLGGVDDDSTLVAFEQQGGLQPGRAPVHQIDAVQQRALGGKLLQYRRSHAIVAAERAAHETQSARPIRASQSGHPAYGSSTMQGSWRAPVTCAQNVGTRVRIPMLLRFCPVGMMQLAPVTSPSAMT